MSENQKHSLPKSSWRQMHLLLLPRDKKRIAILITVMLVAAAFEMVGLAAIQTFMQFLATPEVVKIPLIGSTLAEVTQNERMIWVVSGVTAVFIAKLAIFYWVYAYLSWVITQQKVSISSRLFTAFQKAPQSWHLNRTSSDILRCLREDVSQVVQNVLMPMLELALNIVFSLSILIYLMLALPNVVLLGLLITVTGMLLVMRRTHSILAKVSFVQRREMREEIKAIQQGIGGLTEARILGRREWFHIQYERALNSFAGAYGKQLTIMKTTPVILEVLSVFSLMAVIALIVSISNSAEEAMTLGTIVAAATMRLKQTASKIAVATNKINAGAVFIPSVLKDITELEQLSAKQARNNGLDTLGSFKELKFDQVTYHFSPTDPPALKSLSFFMRSGEHVAVVGKTGAGKSTLINLILGLFIPDRGHILVNGLNMAQNIDAWRSSLGYVPQSIYMLEDTIKANVAFGVPADQIDSDRVAEVLKVAQFDKFLNNLPNGLDTVVGEHGARLSGGQRQRIGVARALYSNPEVLILDEATSALDVETESKLLSAIQSQTNPKSIFTITHRLDTIKNCDRVLFLTGGQLAAQDSYDELINTSPEFREMALVSENNETA